MDKESVRDTARREVFKLFVLTTGRLAAESVCCHACPRSTPLPLLLLLGTECGVKWTSGMNRWDILLVLPQVIC